MSMATTKEKIIYTYTDEAPALATHSFLPIVEAITRAAKVELELRDISLAAWVSSQFPEFLTKEQKVSDDLFELGELAKTPEANIIKLTEVCDNVLTAIVHSVRYLPVELRELTRTLSSAVELRFRDSWEMIMGGFLLLRVFNPAISSPETVGILPSAPTGDVRRGLILVSKVLQALSNQVEFG